jgi:hypothetical protein
MPRLPVDGKRVIEHRITLGTYERERLDTLITGLTIRNVGQPTVALLSDVSAMVTLTAILEAIGIIDLTGLAKKAGGYGAQFIQSVVDGAYNTVDEALNDFENRVNEITDVSIPGEGLVKDALSIGDKLWVGIQILKIGAARVF